MAKIKIGDLVRVKLLNDMYMWVHVLFDSQFIVKGKKEINPYNYFYFYASCYLVNIYSQISTEEELKDDTIFFKGVFIPRKHFAKETIISNIPVDYRQIDFPEHTGGLNSSFWLSKGELALGSIPKEKIHEWNDRFNGGFRDIYSVADSLLYMQNRKSEMQRTNYRDTWKFIPRDFRFYPEYRKEVYGIIGEDPNQSYYELALKHGFDLARFYTNKK